MCIRQCEREGWSVNGNQCGVGGWSPPGPGLYLRGVLGLYRKGEITTEVVRDRSKALLGKNCLLL